MGSDGTPEPQKGVILVEEKTNPAFGKERVRVPEEQRGRQSRPILSETKGERVYMAEPIDETCWAYMKLLREHDKTKKIYPVDPYAEVYQFRDHVFGILTESLDGMGDSWMYLVDGPEKAMLVDTSFGLGDLKGLVDQLTGGKEVIVVNTHGHFDHAYGNAQFGRAYCHEYEESSLANQDEHIWDYLFEEGTGRGIWAEFDRNDLITFKPYEIIPCKDGYTFDLGGGHEVELVFLGGHTAGEAGFLDKKERIFFAGDDIVSMRVMVGGPHPGVPYGQYATVEAFRNNLRKLSKRLDEFDAVFPGHFVTDLENTTITSMLEACEAVCEDPHGNATCAEKTGRGVRYSRYVNGLGTLSYTDNSVYMV